jgi:outer membrane biosynthesis protein TonB
MMDTAPYSKDERKARIVAFIFAVLLLFLILYPFWSYTFPPPEQEGILVSFGALEQAGSSEDVELENQQVANPSEQELEQIKEAKSPPDQKLEKESNPKQTTVETKVVSEEKSPVVKKQPEKQAKEVVKVSQEEIEAKRAEEEKAQQAAFEKTKKQFGDLIKKGAANASSNDKSGDPNGEPDIDRLPGLIAGKGQVEGGLADRGLLFEPKIDESSQKSGKVVVKVCANSRGEITEATYTQRGSTTTDSDLVKAAVEGAKKYRFSRSPIEKQCGTITIEFKLK